MNAPCKTGKVGLDSWQLAVKVRGRHCRQDGARCSVYKCEFCSKWHVGRRIHKTMSGRPVVEDMEETWAHN